MNKEIIELKAKIDTYRNELILSNQNLIKNRINSKYSNEQENSIKNLVNPNFEINNKINNLDNNLFDNKNNNKSNTFFSFNNNKELNIPILQINTQKDKINNNYQIKGLDFQALSDNNKNQFLEINNCKYDNEEGINTNNFNYNNQNIQISNNENIKNNEIISEININSKNNFNSNEFDYSEVLPIIDKVSKLKELNELEEGFENHKTNNLNTQRSKFTNININQNNNEDDDAPNIVNSILDALSNKLIESQLDYNKEKDIKRDNKDEENDINKPKLISKNKNIENKQAKIISFKEFLEKEEKK